MRWPILDAHAILAFLQDETGADRVEKHLIDAAAHEKPLKITAVNWGEVRYRLEKDRGASPNDERVVALSRLPIEIVAVDKSLAEVAADVKARFGIPFVDCFAAALAKVSKAELLTGDPHFKAVEPEVKIAWLR